MEKNDFPLSTGNDKRHLKKSVDSLAIVPDKGKIPLLARKIYNVMMHYAQEQGAEQASYRVRLDQVIKGVEFNSHNTEVLKDHLRQMVTTKVEWQSPTKGEGAKWAVSALIAHAELTNENGLAYLEWSYAVNIKHEILDPQRYARLSLAFQADIKSTPGLVLYEICSRYIDNPGGLTARHPWTWWRPVLTSSQADTPGIYKEYKFFKRDVLKKAVIEVNQVTDIDIALIEHRERGKTIGEIQFSVKHKRQEKLPFGTRPNPVNLEDIGRAINAGVPQEKAEGLLSRFGDQVFKIGVDALVQRLSRKEIGPVKSPVAYLRTTLNELQKNPPDVAVAHPLDLVNPGKQRKHLSSERLAMIEKFRASRRTEAEALFKESIAETQRDLMNRFETEVLPSKGQSVLETYQKRGLTVPMTKSQFTQFLSEHFFGKDWGSPSDTALLDFAITEN